MQMKVQTDVKDKKMSKQLILFIIDSGCSSNVITVEWMLSTCITARPTVFDFIFFCT